MPRQCPATAEMLQLQTKRVEILERLAEYVRYIQTDIAKAEITPSVQVIFVQISRTLAELDTNESQLQKLVPRAVEEMGVGGHS